MAGTLTQAGANVRRKGSASRTIVAIAGLMVGFGGPAAARQTARQSGAPLTVTIDTRQTAAPTSKYEFGMFIEHIGPLIYRSLWSEMLDDRKFYFPITAAKREVQGRQAGFPGRQLRKWRPVGPDDAVTMDKDQPFVGEQSPRISLDGSTPHGIQQSGLSLVKGKQYVGHIWLKGARGSIVKVALIWGEGAKDRETVSFAHLTSTYAKFPFRLTAKADSSDAVFEITGTGTGNFHVGTVSLMPADNVDGFRPDTIALLRQLHSGFWRLPGGNFLSDWSWYDGVGPRDKRPPTYDYAWNAMQPNDVGLDEFMTLCRLIGVEPYITVNAGFGDAHSAGEEVEYMNGPVTTRLGAERARNGHPAPYGVKFWDIGNEPYGAWQLGRTDLKYYVLKHNEFAAAMRKADPSIVLLASGNMPEPMDLTGEMRAKDVDNMKAVEGTPEDWTGGEIEHCWGNFSGITQHWYARSGQRFDVEKAKHLPLDAPTEADTADEEESLFPRLRRAHDPEAQSALAQLEQLEKDHRWADAVHAEVDRLGQRYLSQSRLSAAEAEQFRAAVGQLDSMYQQHIQIEDHTIFPVADRVLSQTERSSIAREMKNRRST